MKPRCSNLALTTRNALLRGEVDPDEQVLAYYEPAYRIVRCFLSCIRQASSGSVDMVIIVS